MRRLTEAAQADRDAFNSYARDSGCACHSMPPCGYCTHPGNPANQDEDERCWENGYTKEEALWYAICQMRRAARMLDLEETQLDGKEYLVDIYGAGLDLCADVCEKIIDPAELRQMKIETFPNTCPTCCSAFAENERRGVVTVCHDEWHAGKEVQT